MFARSVIAICALVACSSQPRRPDSTAPAQPHVVEDAWWNEAHPCASGELRTDALRFADGTRRTLAVFCEDGEARVGRETAWYPNGALRSRGEYENNRPTGDWVMYWPNGKVWYRVTLAAGRPVRRGEMFRQDGSAFALDIDLPVTGMPECDDALREWVKKPTERANAMELATVVLADLENKHRDAVARCGAADGPTVVVP